VVKVPKATVLCPVCGSSVEYINTHPSEDHVIVGEELRIVSTGYGKPYLTLLPCQHRIRHNGFRMFLPQNGRIEGDVYDEPD
jgi:hypothetical protein